MCDPHVFSRFQPTSSFRDAAWGVCMLNVCAVYRVISDLEESGKGRRVSKVSWKDDNFWHIVDVSEHPRSIGAQAKSPTGSDEQHEGNAEEVASEDVQPGVKDIPPLKLPSVFAIKFVDGAPTTGRVVKMKQIFKREWRLLPQQ